MLHESENTLHQRKSPSCRGLPALRLRSAAGRRVFFVVLLLLSTVGVSDLRAGSGPILSFVEEGQLLFQKGDYEAALDAFDKALEIDPEEDAALLGRAMVFSQQRQHAEAFRAYDAVVAESPRNAFAWNGRGLAAFNLEDFDEALFSFEQATADRPMNGFFYESMAWTLMCRGDYERASETAKQAALVYSRTGDSAVYPLLIAYFAYREAGDLSNARRTLAYAVKSKPRERWPRPVVDYLSDRIDAEELISFVTDTAEETEAHTYIGLNLRTMGEYESAARHLSWVGRNGDPRVFEYTLARAINYRTQIATASTTAAETAAATHR